MKVFPATKQGCYKLLLFPFEAYIVLVPVVAIVLELASGYSRGVDPAFDREMVHRYGLLVYGYIGSIATLLLCAVALRDRSLRRSAIIFGVLGLIGIVLLLPAIAVAKSRSVMAGPNNVMEATAGPRFCLHTRHLGPAAPHHGR